MLVVNLMDVVTVKTVLVPPSTLFAFETLKPNELLNRDSGQLFDVTWGSARITLKA